MLFKRKTKKAFKKISQGASRKKIKNAVNEVMQEAFRQLSKRVSKMGILPPVKVLR